jgi:TetR/AcrR family transcriptional repressor of nem operon
MARGGSSTKAKIMDVAESLVLEHGFGATSIDQILEQTGLTKGAFFYHFKSKNQLADALIRRYVERDDALLHDLIGQAENLSRDPLQQILIFVTLLHDVMESLEGPLPGCMIASFVYQFEEFSTDTKSVVINGFDEWHKVLDEKFRQVLEKQPPKVDVSATELVDTLLALFEGGIILSMMVSQSNALSVQIKQYKNYLELLFDVV